MTSSVFDILEQAADTDLATAITRSYQEMEEAVTLAQWKLAGVSAGHFVEAVRRLIERKLFGQYTPISKPLSALSPQTLAKYESGQSDDSYRFHIPRALFAAYGIRNKKGYGHLSLELANHVDVSFMAETCRWALAELIRIESDYSVERTDKLVSQVTERRTPLIWRVGGVERIFDTNMTLRNSIILLLYHNRGMTLEALLRATEAKDAYLKRTVRDLHSKRLIEFSQDRSTCEISPSGSKLAEEILIRMAA